MFDKIKNNFHESLVKSFKKHCIVPQITSIQSDNDDVEERFLFNSTTDCLLNQSEVLLSDYSDVIGAELALELNKRVVDEILEKAAIKKTVKNDNDMCKEIILTIQNMHFDYIVVPGQYVEKICDMKYYDQDNFNYVDYGLQLVFGGYVMRLLSAPFYFNDSIIFGLKDKFLFTPGQEIINKNGDKYFTNFDMKIEPEHFIVIQIF
jgi:hypothetical protein